MFTSTGVTSSQVILCVRSAGYTIPIHNAVHILCGLAHYRPAKTGLIQGCMLYMDQILQFCAKFLLTETISALDAEKIHCSISNHITHKGKLEKVALVMHMYV